MKLELVLPLLVAGMSLRVAHWQTRSYSEHKVYETLYGLIDAFMDKYVEVSQGKGADRVEFPGDTVVPLFNYGGAADQAEGVRELIKALVAEKANLEPELSNMVDDLVANLEQGLFLLTLE